MCKFSLTLPSRLNEYVGKVYEYVGWVCEFVGQVWECVGWVCECVGQVWECLGWVRECVGWVWMASISPALNLYACLFSSPYSSYAQNVQLLCRVRES